MDRQPQQVLLTPQSMQPSSSICILCGGDNWSVSGSLSNNNIDRKAHKRRKNCPGKCQRSRTDECHWSKLLQTGHVPTLSSPPPTSSPPVSPMAAFGQSVCRFFKWISPNRKSPRRNSLGESDRPTSVSSDDCPESPLPKVASPLSKTSTCSITGTIINYKQTVSKSTATATLIARPVAAFPDKEPTLLKTPSSSALMTKRLHEKLHRIQKPTPHLPKTIIKDGKVISSFMSAQPVSIAHKNNTIIVVSNCGSSNTLTTASAVQSINTNGHSPLTVASSCPIVQKKPCFSESSKVHLSDTWPLRNYHLTYVEDDEDVFENKDAAHHSINDKKNVQEFTIAYENTHQDELIGSWRNGNVYKGRWHGNVMIQTYHAEGENVNKEFWEEVTRMSRIRHENIALFMGACTTPGHLALVTSICNGMSLYEKLHILRERISLPVKINLAYQIAQALAYLHAKKITYKNLASKNIFIEKQKATLSVINFSTICKARENASDRESGQLPYLAPELLTYLVSCNELDPPLPHTAQTDIYAFGVLLHELLSGTKPYRNIPKDALILQVSDGRRPLTDKLACPQTLKTLMGNCWARLPHHRPYIHEILKELQKKDVALHNRFSSSEPDSLNKLKSSNMF